jgi:two-component system, LytTR family, response regulator
MNLNTQDRTAKEKPLRTCVVIDDERMGRNFLIGMLRKHFPDIEVLGEADSVETAVALITEKRPDIVFLDVEIIGGSGFDVIRKFPERTFLVVFISAFDSYTKDSNRYLNTKFLLKPISLDEMRAAVSQ